MSKSVIRISNLSKRYRLGQKEKEAKTLIEQIATVLKSPWQNFKRLNDLNRFGKEDDSVFWALKDVSFEVKEGEVLGIIGKNGAGKSTLLKILSQITEPTFGKIEIHGRVASLLEVGTGFHPELSGRENIYMNGTILGMTRKEIDSKLDEIIDFSGVEKFIDTPVKFYSSGMKVRLGFSVAAHLDPEILIIDEVLAVGDFEFQNKCLGKMDEVSKRQGRTVIFVSHHMDSVRRLCSRSVWLDTGRIKEMNSTEDVISHYLVSNVTSEIKDFSKDLNFQYLSFARICLEKLYQGVFELEIAFQSSKIIFEPIFGFVVYNQFDTPIFGSNPRFHKSKNYIPTKSHFGSSTAIIENLNLHSGNYNVSLWFSDGYQELEFAEKVLSFEFVSRKKYVDLPKTSIIGSVDMPVVWQFKKKLV